MIQQVNLFQPIFRETKPMFSAKAISISLLITFLGLLSVYGYAWWQTERLDTEVISLKQQRDTAQARLTGLMKKLPKREQSKVLIREVAQLGRMLSAKRFTVHTLKQRVNGNSDGFSAFFAGLARQKIEGLWVTGLKITDGGRTITLTGRALDPELVPELVTRLSREPVFSGLKFNALNIERGTGEEPGVAFELRTHIAEQGHS